MVITPALVFLSIFLFYPILYLLYLSFTTGSFTVTGIEWVGGRNYLRLFTDADFWQVMGNTVYEQAFSHFEFGYAAAAATILLAIAFIFVYLYLRVWNEPS